MEDRKDVKVFVTGVSAAFEVNLDDDSGTPKVNQEESEGEKIGDSREDD
tara:strand:+ start:166 stop:312 length:147 start_codon:yes stop_codon:yes gene_type:complete